MTVTTRKRKKKNAVTVIWTVILILAAIVAAVKMFGWAGLREFEQLKSTVDFDGDGIDDYTDILTAARSDGKCLVYDGTYVAGGYPADDVGVCTDVIWRAFRDAGYDLKAMVDRDVAENAENYLKIDKPDPNIDFRRVSTLRPFFDRYAVSLTTDPYDLDQWQAGDIVVFGKDEHIGIVSDKRNFAGIAYIIHHGSSAQKKLEEDAMLKSEVTGHYRFDASKIDGEVLIEWSR